MSGRLTDSGAFAHLWGTDEVRALFGERAMYQAWLTILGALAGAQADLGIIPPGAAGAIAQVDVDSLDADLVVAEARRTSHSTLGFITAVRQVLAPEAAEYVYYGITVQDLSDTWTVLVLRDVGEVVWRDLHALEGLLIDLALEHRLTVMAGRTHGQPGAPITFGMKVASWADEVRRHIERLAAGRDRWLTGQLGGAVGTLGFFGDDGPALRAAFCARLGLADPLIAWLTARDRPADLALLLAMVCSTLARIGGEVYELSRPEIGEVREPLSPATVGSITMPHKRNPERAEHLDTLARLARANAGVLLEGMVAAHERDGRAWKAEWAALPEVCLVTSTALRLAREIVDGLEVDTVAMAANIAARGGYLSSEEILADLSAKVGKHAAQAQLQSLFSEAQRSGRTLLEALDGAGLVDPGVARAIVEHPSVTTASAVVDAVVARAVGARAVEAERWS
ncbi:MAG: adenylosuccinate lyase family protein [Actinomycetota bacterium]|nr:adenylosuccinate lyase family protein [Actinomycetota bacterium]